MKRKSSASQFAKIVGVSSARGMEATLKAQLISAIIDVVNKEHITHAELAKRSRVPRSAITGILAGSLQKITIDRILKLIAAVGLTAEIRVKKTA